jgi:hypothetical protein
MAALGEYDRAFDAVHGIGLGLVWCPKYRRRTTCRYVAEQTLRPEEGRP